jgi:signal transduction histidine kinase
LRSGGWYGCLSVESGGRLRGVLLAGLRKKRGVLPVQLLESVSAELALAVELDDERRRARQQQADISVTNCFLEELASAGPSDAALARLVESCTDTGTEGDGLGAAFAVLRARGEAIGISSPAPRAKLIAKRASVPKSLSDMSAQAQPQANQRCVLSWQSGDAAWQQSLDSQYLEGIWQQARKAHDTVIIRAESGTVWPRGEVSRVVANGLEAAGENIGVLAAGFRGDYTSRAAIERLESRAALATSALVLRERNQQASRHQAREKAVLQADSAGTILVDEVGLIVGLSRGAREMLPEGQHDSRLPGGESGQTPPMKFAELFHAWDQPRVETWLRSVLADSTIESVLDADGRRIGRVEIYRDLSAQRVFQSKLLHTEKLAALGQMVTGVAHELSNPFTSILGYAQRLFLRSQSEGASDEVRQIFQEAERASMIVRRLLMSARESRPERRRVR